MKTVKFAKLFLVAVLIISLPIAFAFDGKVEKARDIKQADASARDEALIEKIPETYDLADAQIVPYRHRYLMWTNDGSHVMWGNYGNGHFVGTDNIGKNAWGIYGKNVFAGFYDNQFFWGKYSSGRWHAFDLFGLKESHGGYLLFPVKYPPIEARTKLRSLVPW